MENSGAFPSGQLAAQYDIFEGTPYKGARRLGAGGMGEVYLVEHRHTGRELVAKLLHEQMTSEPRLLERMRIEAQSLGQLNHEHIVKIVGFDKTVRGGRQFLVMEYLVGRTLAEEISERERLPVLEAVTLACQLLSALEVTHEKGIVHRDIKPENLFICRRENGSPCLKVLDFGLVRIMPENKAVAPLPRALRTETGLVLGTPRFVSPEAARGLTVDARADLYTAGLILYVMLAGRDPFAGIEDPSLLVSAHAVVAPQPPSRFAATPVPPELDRLVLKALAKSPSERFQTASEFREVLLHVMDLLQRPTGWLETTAFDASKLESSPTSAEPETTDRVALGSDGGDRRDEAHSDTTNDQPSLESQQLTASRTARSPLLVALVFVLGMVIAGIAAIGLVAVVSKGP